MDKRSVKAKCYIMINVNYLTLNMSASQVATLSIAELLHALHGCIPMVYGFSGISLLISYSYATPWNVYACRVGPEISAGDETVDTEADKQQLPQSVFHEAVIMRPSSLGGGRILRRTLSVCPSVCLSVRPSRYGASLGAT